jgi:hypothetical protein
MFSSQRQSAISSPTSPGSVVASPVRLVIAMVALSSGFFVPLHIIGLLSVLRGLRVSGGLILLGCLAGVCGAAVLLRFLRIPGRSWFPVRPAGFMRLILALAVLPYLLFFVAVFLSFPNGYDADGYHLNLALRWLQTCSLRLDPALGWAYSFPSNAELPALFAFAAGVPNASVFGNLFSAVLLFASVYLIAFRVTGERESSLLAAVVPATIPMVIFQAFDLYVDLFGTAFILAAGALLIWREGRPLLSILLCGYAVGLSIGSKPVFWVYAALFVPAALIVIARAKRGLIGTLLLGSGIVLGCGFWFYRAFAATGNPFFPLIVPAGIWSVLLSAWATAVAIGSRPLFWVLAIPVTAGTIFAIARLERRVAGVILLACVILAAGGGWFFGSGPHRRLLVSQSAAAGYPILQITGGTWVDYRSRALLIVGRLWSEETFLDDVPVGPDRGTGPLFPAIAVPGILFLIVQAFRKELSAGKLVLLLGTVTCLFVWLFVLHQIPRFAMPGLAIACAAAAPMLQRLLIHARKVVIILFSAGLALILFFCAAVPAQSLMLRMRMHDWSRATYYGYPPMIDMLPPGSRILDHTGFPTSYPLAGVGLTNWVLPQSPLEAVGYVARMGPEDHEDQELRSRGAALIYNATPRSLHPKNDRPWRIYSLQP